MDKQIEAPARRSFLKISATAGAGLTLGFWLGADPAGAADGGMGAPGKAAAGAAPAGGFAPNAFLRITQDDSVVVIVKHLEMGQGTYTGLPVLVAEELDASWSQVRVEGAPADAKRYHNLHWGPMQGTGGSSSLANSYDQLRQAGAAARAMLVGAAAKRWGVPAEEIKVQAGVVSHPGSRRTARFGELAEAAAAEPVPEKVALKDPKDFKLIGGHVPRKDSVAKTTGRAKFTQDVKLPAMLVAVVAHPPRFGGKVKNFDPEPLKAMPGVRYVLQIPQGVAVVATDFWTAKKARDALKIEWDESQAFTLGTPEILAQFRELAAKPGAVAKKSGNVAAALEQAGKAGKLIEASFEFPYLAHAAMEPMNCVIHFDGSQCEVWNGEQMHTGDQMALAQALGIKPEQVKLNMLYAGGSFGRRANPHADYLLEAAAIVRAIPGKAPPVKLVWTREDDTRAGFYRPAYLHTLKAALGTDGLPLAWQHRLIGQSILAGTAFESVMVKDGVDATSVEGAVNLPYEVPNFLCDLHSPKLGVPVQWWRAVGSTHTAYSTEVGIDLLAAAAGKDPVAFRRQLLANHPRHLAALDLVAEKAGWSKPLAKGERGEKRGRGIALHESFGTVVAQVAEVTVRENGNFRVARVVCAVDCGVAVTPDVVRAQMEGGIAFALSAVLHGAITLKDGEVEQSNFHQYRVLNIAEMPKVDVHIVPSAAKPSGVGEPGVPPLAPAVANALTQVTGKRYFKLPLESA